MKNFVFIGVIFFLFVINSVSAQTKDFGAGIIIGEPTGLSAKYWLNENNALVYGFGSSFAANGRIHLHVDYLWHRTDIFQTAETIALYYGPGVRVKTQKFGNSVLGIRGVLGAAWFVKTAPMDVFVEIVPVLNLTPDVNVSINAGIGARYFF